MTAPAINRPYYAGEERPAHAGPVDVVMQCIRPGAAYRVSVRYASTGAEISNLSKSHPTEQAAREHATTALLMFRSGVTVEEALDMQDQRPEPNPARPLDRGEVRTHTTTDVEVSVQQTPAGGYLVQLRKGGEIIPDACRHYRNETPALHNFAALVAAHPLEAK